MVLGCAGAPVRSVKVQAAPEVAPERARAADSYLDDGLPQADHPWSAAEYEAAVRALEPVVARDPSQLPRVGSPRSGAVFERFCAVDNLASLEDASVPAVRRLLAGSDYLKGALGLLRVYYRATVATGGYPAELVNLMGLSLRLSALLAEAGSQVPQPQDEAHLGQYHEGRVELTNGFGHLAEGCLRSVAERDLYPEPDRLRLTAFLQAELPRLFPFLPPQSRQQIPGRIKRLAADEPSPPLRSALEALSASLARLNPAGPS